MTSLNTITVETRGIQFAGSKAQLGKSNGTSRAPFLQANTGDGGDYIRCLASIAVDPSFVHADSHRAARPTLEFKLPEEFVPLLFNEDGTPRRIWVDARISSNITYTPMGNIAPNTAIRIAAALEVGAAPTVYGRFALVPNEKAYTRRDGTEVLQGTTHIIVLYATDVSYSPAFNDRVMAREQALMAKMSTELDVLHIASPEASEDAPEVAEIVLAPKGKKTKISAADAIAAL